MKNYWISWEHEPYGPDFKTQNPCWMSGQTIEGCHFTYIIAYPADGSSWVIPNDSAKRIVCICAAIRANSEDEAKQLVLSWYKAPVKLEWRFISEREKDFNPFNDRFIKEDWMTW